MNRPEPGARPDVPGVSELTERIRSVLEPNFSDILVEGELSNIYRSRNGHLYFTVKDSRAQLPCVTWSRTVTQLGLDPQDGQQVILGGSIEIYPPHGKYQLIVTSLQQAGVGRLQQAFERLKEKLRGEGLFEASRKRPLPRYPKRIGVITSSAGAAFHDITSTLERRWPLARVLLYHSSVQGALAAPELVRGIRLFGSDIPADLLIIGRGGGSLEDLWPFNEESVARAIAACPVPVISAVGHETDFSISDFVADVRAATPTQAALLATPDANEVRLQVDERSERMAGLLREREDRLRSRIEQLGRSHALLVTRRRLDERRSRLQHLADRVELRLAGRIPGSRERAGVLSERLYGRLERLHNTRREQLSKLLHRLEMANPGKPLEQGFVRVWQNEKWIRDPKKLERARSVELEWKSGRTRIGTDGRPE